MQEELKKYSGTHCVIMKSMICRFVQHNTTIYLA